MQKLQTCVVAELEGCEDPTPANLLDSIFNYIKKVTPCDKMLSDAPQAAAQVAEVASMATKSTGFLALALFAVLVAMY